MGVARLIIRPKRPAWKRGLSAETAMLIDCRPDGYEERAEGLRGSGAEGLTTDGADGSKNNLEGAKDGRA